jgi:hypothetical protein
MKREPVGDTDGGRGGVSQGTGFVKTDGLVWPSELTNESH